MSSFSPTEDHSPDSTITGRRGRLKIFLGYAAGVGKTFRMLEEAQQLKRQGVDVVIGYFEPHGRKNTIAKSQELEAIPRRKICYRDTAFEEMDTAAIIDRHPAVCLVDELAHTNVPGAERAKRWQDVDFLLEAGIDVFTTLNVQHLESLNDKVYEISGIRVRETVPDWLVKHADEVVMVDATTGALMNRLRRGDVYAPEKAQRAMENFFKETTLSALRELALRHTALELDLREAVAAETGTNTKSQTQDHDHAAGVLKDRILIHLTPQPSTAMLIRRGRRVADFLNADCFAIFIYPKPDLAGLPESQREAVAKHINFARNLRIETRVLESTDAVKAIVDFANQNRITQILLARPQFKWWTQFLGNDFVMKIIRKAKNLRVAIVAERK